MSSRTMDISHPKFIQDLAYTFGSDVSASGWKRSSGDTRKAYDFSYDGLLRLKDAAYSGDFHFHDSVNSSAEYAYDATRNLVSDANKSISSVTWNEIDLPQTVTFSNGSTINSKAVQTKMDSSLLQRGSSGREVIRMLKRIPLQKTHYILMLPSSI